MRMVAAATRIQALVRGFLARKALKKGGKVINPFELVTALILQDKGKPKKGKK